MPDNCELSVAIDKSGIKAVKHDHKNKHAELHQGDSLKFTRGAGWTTTEGFTEIKFWRNKTDYDNRATVNPFARWQPSTASLRATIQDAANTDHPVKFAAVAEFEGALCKSIKLTDSEPYTGDGRDEMYYLITIGGIEMDPEIVNKSGSGAGSTVESHWADNTA